MIFFDNASTTRVFDEAVEKMSSVFLNDFYNPSALYGEALRVHNLVENSRQVIADGLGAAKSEVFFTSCATESNNWVLNCGFKNKRGNLVISEGEHASVFECAMSLKAKGYEVRLAKLKTDGRIDSEDLIKKVDENTGLVSVIHCSNETGAINDLGGIARVVKAKNARTLVHSDGVQAFCKLRTDVNALGIDFYTVSAHKIGGPKGCGVLYVNKKHNIAPFITGGGQERGLRSGTENTSGIIGFAEAVNCFARYYEPKRTRQIFNYIYDVLTGCGWIYSGSEFNSGFVLSLSMPGLKAEILQHMLSGDAILIGLGSACSSKTSENRVLTALGRTKKEISGNIRISLSVFSTLQEAETLCKRIDYHLQRLKAKNIG